MILDLVCVVTKNELLILSMRDYMLWPLRGPGNTNSAIATLYVVFNPVDISGNDSIMIV